MEETKVGIVTHFFQKPMVAAVKIESGVIRVGDKLRFSGHSTDFVQGVDSLQIEHLSVTEGKPGDLIGLKVKDRVREHDQVFKVTGE